MITKNKSGKEAMMLKKKELFIILGILAFSILLWGISAIVRKGEHPTVKITVDGEEYGTYNLDEDQLIHINDTNTCEIRDGKVYMTEATCPDKLCIHQKAIDKTGGIIICLPNKVVIEGEKTVESNSDEPEIDTVA